MLRGMRRSRQALDGETCKELLYRGSNGVLAVLGDDGYPYAVPLSYVFDGSDLYFHCAVSGHKLDAIRRYEKVSFCVVDQDRVVAEELTTYFRSVIVFGRARLLTEENAKRDALKKLAEKYAPGREAEQQEEIRAQWDRVAIVRITPESITGKEAIELVREKKTAN